MIKITYSDNCSNNLELYNLLIDIILEHEQNKSKEEEDERSFIKSKFK